MMSFVIYGVKCNSTGKIYIGYTSNLEERWKRHSKGLTNKPLSNSINKYGISNHDLIVMEKHPTKNEALEAEIWWIAYLRQLGAQLFNLTSGGDAPKNHSLTVEQHQKLSEAMRKRWADSRANPAIGIGMRGKRHSQETKNKLSLLNSGKTQTAEIREKKSAAMRGRKPSALAIEKARISNSQLKNYSYLIGQEIGNKIIIAVLPTRTLSGLPKVEIQCNCGRHKIVSLPSAKNSKTCGCAHNCTKGTWIPSQSS